VRSRESAWIPFTPLLSRPSFSGYITTSGNPLFGKFFRFSVVPAYVTRARTRSAVSSRFADVYRFCACRSGRVPQEYRCSLLFAIDNTDSSIRRSLVVSHCFLSRFVCNFCVVPRASDQQVYHHRELILHE